MNKKSEKWPLLRILKWLAAICICVLAAIDTCGAFNPPANTLLGRTLEYFGAALLIIIALLFLLWALDIIKV